jgi:hypothetical protein
VKFNLGVARVAAVVLFSAVVSAAAAQDKPAGDATAGDLARVQSFLRQELGNPAITVKPKAADAFEVMAGDKPAGTIATVDGGDYEWKLVVPLSAFSDGGAVDLKKTEPFLKSLLGKRVSVTSVDDASAHFILGDDIDGSLTVDRATGTVHIDSLFFAADLPEPRDSGGAKASGAIDTIEPVDSANATLFARLANVKVFDEPSAAGASSATLKAGQQVKVTGGIKGRVGYNWYRLDYADGKPRFVAADDLIDEKTEQRKRRYGVLINDFPLLLSQTGASSGPLAPYMGFYTLGSDCRLQPVQSKPIDLPGFEKANRLSQDVQDLFWSGTSWALWSDGTHVFRLSVDGGTPDRFKPTFVRKVKFKDHGDVQIWRMERVEPAGFDPDLSIVGFAENGRLLLSIEIDGNNFKSPRASTRCPSLGAVKEATAQFYKVWLARLAGLSRDQAIGPPPKLLTLDTAANPKFFVRTKGVTLRTTADDNSAAAGELKEDEEIKLVGVYPVGLGEAWNDRRWWKVETKSGSTGFVLGRHLISEEGQRRKQKLLGNIELLVSAINKPPFAKGPHVRLSGIVARDGCEQKEPDRIAMDTMLDERKSRVQFVTNNVWLGRMTYVWFDGNMLNRISLSDPSTVRQYRVTPFKTIKLVSIGSVRLFKTVQIDGPEDDRDDDWSTIGFAEDGDILTGVVAEGRSYRFIKKRRCPNRMVPELAEKAFEIYEKNVLLLPMSRDEIKALPE